MASSPKLADLAERALARGEEVQALARLSAWLARHPHDVAILHWSAMLNRALDRREAAIAALDTARRIDPANAGVAHALAHVALEAGISAAGLFERAIALAPARGELRLGLASARLAEGDGERALTELAAMLEANPGWYEGHRQFAQLNALMGRSGHSLASIEAALQRYSGSHALHKLRIDLLLEAERFAEALDAAHRALQACGEQRAFVLAQAFAIDELGRSDESVPIYQSLGPARDIDDAVIRVRHHLRRGAAERARDEVEPWLEPAGAAGLWPYAALVWRVLDDPRAEWLDRRGGLVKVVELDAQAVDFAGLRGLLRCLHAGSGRFLGQSVRGGTQTEGVLLARIEPEIATLRERLRQEVGRYLRALPQADAGHPTLRLSRDREPRFAGSWSVRLQSEGFHAAHQHPLGCISSALYLAVPEGPDADKGILELGGAPAALGVTLDPLASVIPQPGRLVLFPSWMWHATRPFAEGERLTVAFDIACP